VLMEDGVMDDETERICTRVEWVDGYIQVDLTTPIKTKERRECRKENLQWEVHDGMVLQNPGVHDSLYPISSQPCILSKPPNKLSPPHLCHSIAPRKPPSASCPRVKRL
jgi:hypothetical protein